MLKMFKKKKKEKMDLGRGLLFIFSFILVMELVRIALDTFVPYCIINETFNFTTYEKEILVDRVWYKNCNQTLEEYLNEERTKRYMPNFTYFLNRT